MQMSHFSVDLQHSLTRFHKPAMDPTQNQSLLSEGHVAPTSPHDKEALFEKPLTPSDVGKLNRLVIPKQYAEKYFPLGGGGGGDAGGTLLGFEDEAGKCWRFRYSYWNSSQSYVLTKGWSRYVKEKALDAGDVVVFERHRAEPDRLFIGWRRRGVPQLPTPFGYNAQGYGTAQDSRGSAHGAHPYQAEPRRVAGVGPAEQEEQRTPGIGNTNSTRLVRLFGVNFECQLSRDQSSSGTTSSQGSSQQPIRTQQHSHQEAHRNYFNHMGLPPNHRHQHHHMELEFTQGAVERMGNRLG